MRNVTFSRYTRVCNLQSHTPHLKKYYKYIRQKKIKIGLAKIRKALNELDSYTVYKNTPKRFPRQRVRVQTQYQQVEIDLMDVRKSSEFNDGVKYLFVAVSSS